MVEDAARRLGSALAALVNALDPGAVIVGGGLGLDDGYRAQVERALRADVYDPGARALPVLPAALGADAPAIGAALAGGRLTRPGIATAIRTSSLSTQREGDTMSLNSDHCWSRCWSCPCSRSRRLRRRACLPQECYQDPDDPPPPHQPAPPQPKYRITVDTLRAYETEDSFEDEAYIRIKGTKVGSRLHPPQMAYPMFRSRPSPDLGVALRRRPRQPVRR